jgi:DnaA family protein
MLLDFQPAPLPSLVNFVAGRNLELIDALRTLPHAEHGKGALYVWGDTGSGKTHLLMATIALYLSRGLNAVYVNGSADWTRLSAYDAVAVDDVQMLDEENQIGLFNLFNDLREAGRPLIVAGRHAPQALEIRPDLRTRLGWDWVYQAHALSDDEKSQALQRHASERGFRLPQDVVDYLLAHVRRDLPSLMGMLDALDKWSLTAKKPVTVSLLKQLMQPPSSNATS